MAEKNSGVDPQRNYSLKVAAQYWGVAPSTVRAWALQGKFRTIKMGRRRVVPGTELLRIKNEGLKG